MREGPRSVSVPAGNSAPRTALLPRPAATPATANGLHERRRRTAGRPSRPPALLRLIRDRGCDPVAHAAAIRRAWVGRCGRAAACRTAPGGRCRRRGCRSGCGQRGAGAARGEAQFVERGQHGGRMHRGDFANLQAGAGRRHRVPLVAQPARVRHQRPFPTARIGEQAVRDSRRNGRGHRRRFRRSIDRRNRIAREEPHGDDFRAGPAIGRMALITRIGR
jgi:hypothetical protein